MAVSLLPCFLLAKPSWVRSVVFFDSYTLLQKKLDRPECPYIIGTVRIATAFCFQNVAHVLIYLSYYTAGCVASQVVF